MHLNESTEHRAALRRREAYKPFVMEIGNEQPLNVDFVNKARCRQGSLGSSGILAQPISLGLLDYSSALRPWMLSGIRGPKGSLSLRLHSPHHPIVKWTTDDT